ncbi:urease accessory protein UreD [Yoonia sp. MH D7]
MTAYATISSSPALQRAVGELNISAQRASGDITRLKNLRQQGSYRAIFPRSINGNVDAVIVNTAGGVTGGDQFSITVAAHEDAQVSVTTQAAERIYRASGTAAGVMQTKLRAEANAQLYWLPQETILFEGSRLQRHLEVDLHASAKFLMVEPLVFGRSASGETLRSGGLDDRVSITSGGRPIYLDRIILNGDIAKQLGRPAVANAATAVASIVLADPAAKRLLEPVRALLPPHAGASLLSETVLVVRILASDSYALRTTIFSILKLLSNNAVPKNWRL